MTHQVLNSAVSSRKVAVAVTRGGGSCEKQAFAAWPKRDVIRFRRYSHEGAWAPFYGTSSGVNMIGWWWASRTAVVVLLRSEDIPCERAVSAAESVQKNMSESAADVYRVAGTWVQTHVFKPSNQHHPLYLNAVCD